MSTHWGEIPQLRDTESGIAAMEREQLTKPRPMEVEGPTLHQPNSQDLPPPDQNLPTEQFATESFVQHSIKLIQHTAEMNAKLSEGESFSLPSPSPIPEFTGRQLKHQITGPMPFLPKDPENLFVRGTGKPPPDLDSKTTRKLLRKSVAAMLAHAGFTTCQESLLETMTDLCQEYFLQFTRQLRRAVDSEALHADSGFPDAMERVFQEMGIGSTTVLHDFYQKRILGYHDNMLQKSQGLMEEYQRASNPDSKTSDDMSYVKVKEEAISDIQFPNMDESEESGETDQILLEGLGLDVTMGHESTSNSALGAEEESKWQNSIKSDTAEMKVGCLDQLEQDDPHNTSEVAHTPAMSSDTGDSIQDPGSVPHSDIMSPPPAALRTSKPPKKKKRKA